MFVACRLLFLVMGFLTAVSPISAATFSTSAHPLESSLLFDVYLGDPSENPGLPPLGAVGPAALNGTAEIDLNLDVAGDGTVQFQGSSLEFESFSGTFDLDALGTIDYDFQAVTLTFSTMPIAVSNGDYAAPFNDDVNLTFFSGTLVIGNATGTLADLVGTGPLFVRDYDVEPITAFWPTTTSDGFSGTVDSGTGGFVPAAEASLIIPGVTFPVIDVPDFGPISLGLSGEVFLAVPEPSSLSLAALGLAGLSVCGWRKHVRTRDGIARPAPRVT